MSRTAPAPPEGRARRSRMTLMAGAAAVVVLAAVLAVVLSGADDEDGGGAGSDVPAAVPARVTVDGTSLPRFAGTDGDPAAGMSAPALTGVSFDGTQFAIGPDGTPKIVMFLAHWCPHCQREVPVVQEWLDEKGNPDGVDLYSVSTSVSADRPNHPPEKWLAREGWTVPVIQDEGSKASEAYGLSSFPFFVFLDGDNRVVGRAAGELSIESLEAVVKGLRRG